MAEELNIQTNISKKEKYELLLPQIGALIEGEPSLIANLANVAAALRQTFGFFWVGFYLVDGDELVLGPFQGDVACTRIGFGKGVCGTSWKEKQTIIVPNVDAFPGHIACSSASRSEIVIPFISNEKVIAILDVDSHVLNDFDADDKDGLEKIATLLTPCFG
ncbi:MAG: GAF domain-containing protein [Flavobacteriales bacterium]|nr:GAF domain-containing protein [Flavobacteriales bacterium]